jgi:hypothetical protein
MVGLLASGAGNLISGITGAIGASQAAKAQAKAIDAAAGQIKQYTGQAAGYQQPYYTTGTQNTTTLSNMVNSGAFKTDPYNFQTQQYQDNQAVPGMPSAQDYGQQPGSYAAQEFNYTQDPGYQFQLQQGRNSILGGAGAGGSMLSGATQKALAKYGVGLANQNYNDSYNRYANDRSFDYNNYQTQLGQYNTNRNYAQNAYETQLGQYNANRNFGANRADAYNQYGMANEDNRYNAANQQAAQDFANRNVLANYGVGAANNLSNLYSDAGTTLGNLTVQKGNAKAAGINGIANAFGSAINGLGGLGTKYEDLKSAQAQTAATNRLADIMKNK